MPSLGIAQRPGGCVDPTDMPTQDAAPVSGVISGGCYVPSLEIGLQAIQLSPYRAGPAAARPQRLRGVRCFADMLLSPSPFGSRSVIRPRNNPPSSSQLRWVYDKAPRGA